MYDDVWRFPKLEDYTQIIHSNQIFRKKNIHSALSEDTSIFFNLKPYS